MTNLHTSRRIWAMIAVAVTSLMAAQAHGDTDKYPSRPITVVVPYTPGGSVDTVARLVTAQLQKQLGQPIVIENKPGASGMIGSEYVARAKPDGYTLLLHASSQVYLPLVDARVKYDALKDFTPIARLGTVPLLVVTGAQSPFNTLKELQTQAHAKKDSLTWATSGYGTSSHLVEEMLNRDLKLGMQIVPYRGAAPQLTDVTAGHVSAAASPMPGAYPYVASGKLKALAVTSSSRVSRLPNVPTVAESGVEGFDFSSWYGVWGPAGLPANIASQLATEINKAIHAPEVTKVFDTMMFEVAETSPQDLAKVQQDEHDKISLLAKEADIAVK
ncbi:Bug family tripartite tricarboxylate transporter substrate binding protein [Bordetella muralis]|uniref:Bug family tripartite tricarboxylate transporter substrate binding protein n=1 Tax=Bordetella muralis TaxID=1649130 RepID=UPI0039EEF707